MALMASSPLGATAAEAQADFVVRTPGGQFAFQINGTDNLTLTLVRGGTYRFDVQTSRGFHPFRIYSSGVDVNGIDSGIITYRVPTNDANYFYDCTSHVGAMRGDILTIPPADFLVRTPGGQLAFEINGVNSPTLTLVRGRTYLFDVDTTREFHLFHIYSFGLSANDIDFGRMAYTVPMANENYFYDCSGHEGLMRGRIITIPPPTLPSFRILSLAVGSNLVLTSTGTNAWTVSPEFRTNLTTANWQPLAVQTSRFTNGINEVICGRPAGSNVFIRLRAQPTTP